MSTTYTNVDEAAGIDCCTCSLHVGPKITYSHFHLEQKNSELRSRTEGSVERKTVQLQQEDLVGKNLIPSSRGRTDHPSI